MILRLRSHLLALALGAFVPLLVFALILTVVLHRQERLSREHGLRDTARALSLAVDRALQAHIATLEALATSVHLDRGDVGAFARDAGRVLATQPRWSNLIVFDRAGRDLKSLAPPPADLSDARRLVRDVASSGRASVSDTRAMPYGEGHVITVSVPVVRDGRIRYVLSADLVPGEIHRVLEQQQLDPEWLGAIIDRRARLVARTRAADLVGGRVNDELAESLTTQAEGSFRGRTPGGADGLVAYSRSPLTGWTVAIAVPIDNPVLAVRRSLGGLLGIGLLLGGTAAVLALLLGRRIAGSMRELSEAALALGRGEARMPAASDIAEVNAVAAAMHEAARLLAQRADERARAEAALQEREERLRLALGAGQMVTWDWDLRTGAVAWGDDVGVFAGHPGTYNLTADDALGFVHPEDRPLLRDTLDWAIKDGSACEAEFRVGTAERMRGWGALRGRALVDARGAPIRMLGVAMDITGRKRAEADSTALAAIVESSDDAIVGKTLDGRIVSWNAGAERVYGFGAAEIKGQSVAVLFPPEQRDEVPAMLARVRAGEHVAQADGVRLRKDGTRIDVSVTISPIRAGGRIVGASTISRDVTEQRRTERRLASLQALTDVALAHASLDDLMRALLGRLCAALGCDVATILLLSDDGQRLVVRASHGLPEEEGVVVAFGRGVAGRIAAERRPCVIDDLADADIESPVLRGRGLVSLLGVPLLVDQRVVGVVHIATARRRRFTDDELRLMLLAADRMALAVDHARLFEAERAARAEAESANRTKDQFLATLSHELRTPLTSMLGWLRMLRSGRLDERTAARALETVERSTRAQAQLINDLLDVSRITSGKLIMDVAPVDIADVVAAAVEAVRPLAEAKSIAVRHRGPARPPVVQGDSGRLQQVVSNLLSNAVKFTPERGRVTVDVVVHQTDVAIAVADTGKGIAPALLPEIFERFRQASIHRGQGGLGLGLAIVRHLVALHGGHVSAQSAGVGLGATFVVRLPLAGAAVAAPERREGLLEFPRLDGVRVLVVDDEADARTLMSTVLGQCGADVAMVGSARAALDALGRGTYDVLLSDISMPEEDGYQLIRKVRAMNAAIPAAAVTAFAREEDRDAALAAGFQLHLAKPVEPAVLARAVESLAGRAA